MLKAYATSMDRLYKQYGNNPFVLRQHIDTLQLSVIGSVGVAKALEIFGQYAKGVKE